MLADEHPGSPGPGGPHIARVWHELWSLGPGWRWKSARSLQEREEECQPGCTSLPCHTHTCIWPWAFCLLLGAQAWCSPLGLPGSACCLFHSLQAPMVVLLRAHHAHLCITGAKAGFEVNFTEVRYGHDNQFMHTKKQMGASDSSASFSSSCPGTVSLNCLTVILLMIPWLKCEITCVWSH